MGTLRPTGRIHKVIWIWMENQSFSAVLPSAPALPAAPYIASVAAGCGIATNYHNISHPSLPNYVAAVSGGTQGLKANCAPSVCSLTAPTLFGQLANAGMTWTSYVEGMPAPCTKADSGNYTALINPAVYFKDLASLCASNDVPLGQLDDGALAVALRTQSLPAFSFVTPDLCNDMHDCSIATGDAWLSNWLPKITSSPEYVDGSTVVFVTWDEGEGWDFSPGEDCSADPSDESCHVAVIALSPFVVPGIVVSPRFDHYSLLRTTEDILGLPSLGHAADPGEEAMLSAFHLTSARTTQTAWRLIKTFGSRRTAAAAAREANARLRGQDFEASVRPLRRGFNVVITGLYTTREALAVRSTLAASMLTAAIRP